jgi:hypothetical protein
MYDVFLSHNSQDKPQVRALADWLNKHGVRFFLDERDLEPGDILTDKLGEAIEQSKSAVICIGPNGEGPWHREEMDTLRNRSIKLSRQKNEFRIIPALLPKADTTKLRWFLGTRLWCDLSNGVGESESELLRLKRAILGERPDAAPVGDPSFNPYQGLKAFDRLSAEFFFGRAKECAQLAGQLHDWRFTCILGASGSGKSSLAKAGLCTDAAIQTVPGITDWQRLTLRPGRDLLRSLLDQLFLKLPDHERGAAVAAAVARIVPDVARVTSESWAAGLDQELSSFYSQDQEPVLILIDQFEELFTHRDLLPSSNQQRSTSIKLVLDGLAILRESDNQRWRLLLTLRSDFKDRCRISERFWHLLTKGDPNCDENYMTLILEELDEQGWREAIKSPATRAGAYLEEGLVESMLKDVYRQRGSMPLLQLTLQELWRNRNGACMTHAAYKSIGGVAHALQQKAESTLAQLKKDGEEYFDIARNLFLRLTSPGEGVSDTRRRANRTELAWEGIDQSKVDFVIETETLSNVENRLLVTDEQFVEVTHEVLIRDCSTIRGWIEAVRPKMTPHRRLSDQTAEWIAKGCPTDSPTYLLTGARLEDAELLAQSKEFPLNTQELAFLSACRLHRKREADAAVALAEQERLRQERELERARQHARRQRTISTVAVIAASIAVVFGIMTLLLVRNLNLKSKDITQRATTAIENQRVTQILGGTPGEKLNALAHLIIEDGHTLQWVFERARSMALEVAEVDSPSSSTKATIDHATETAIVTAVTEGPFSTPRFIDESDRTSDHTALRRRRVKAAYQVICNTYSTVVENDRIYGAMLATLDIIATRKLLDAEEVRTQYSAMVKELRTSRKPPAFDQRDWSLVAQLDLDRVIAEAKQRMPHYRKGVACQMTFGVRGDRFWILKLPVSYGNLMPSRPDIENYHQVKDHPVTGVTWYQANTIAVLLGGSLPSAQRWHSALLSDQILLGGGYGKCRPGG